MWVRLLFATNGLLAKPFVLCANKECGLHLATGARFAIKIHNSIWENICMWMNSKEIHEIWPKFIVKINNNQKARLCAPVYSIFASNHGQNYVVGLEDRMFGAIDLCVVRFYFRNLYLRNPWHRISRDGPTNRGRKKKYWRICMKLYLRWQQKNRHSFLCFNKS